MGTNVNTPATSTQTATKPAGEGQDSRELPVIAFESVSFTYDPAKPILEGLSWQVERGDLWAILGPSGSGKTTLLHLIAGIRHPGSGQVLVGGEGVSAPRREVGLMLQDYGLLPWYTVARNLEVGLKIRGLATSEIKARTEKWLKRLELKNVRDQYPGQLSGGQRQRVALARLLTLEPEVLLLDEPLSAVDELARERLQKRLFTLTRDAGATTIMVTHNIEEAALLAKHILLITDYAPIRGYETLTTPFSSFPKRGDPDFIRFCQAIREKVGLA